MEDVSPVLLRAFVGLLVRAGLERSANQPLSEFWSTDKDKRRIAFPATMPRDRFLEILSNLSSTIPITASTTELNLENWSQSGDMDFIQQQPSGALRAWSHLTVDESMVPFGEDVPSGST